jgi:negative regulator of flagellin synthesis FlgM
MVAELPYFTGVSVHAERGCGTVRVSEEIFRVSRLGLDRENAFSVSTGTTAATVRGTIATAPLARPNDTMEQYAANPLDVHRVVEAMEAVPDVREDVIASLRARIEAGTYAVSGEQVAEMLMRRFYADSVR